MSFADRLIHRLTIVRETDTGAVDDYGQPIRTPADLATVRGLVQPKAIREVELTNNAGVVVGDHTIYLLPTDITAADRVKFADPADTRRYEVTGVRDAAGIGHHLEVDARLIGSEEGAA